MQLWFADQPESYAGQVVGNGQCVIFVQTASKITHTSTWRRCDTVHHDQWPADLVIATFDPDGTYGNHTDGSSHAAVLIEVLPEGLRVWDQWAGHPVSQRTIRFKGGEGQACDDGDRFSPVRT
jgi:hypothetical protein